MHPFLRRAVAVLLATLATLAPARAQMANPGAFGLFNANGGDFQIGAAGTQTGAPLIGLQGLNAASLQVRFNWGSGGTQTNVFIQSSIDQGQTWFDIANIQFTTSSGTELINLSGLDKLTTPTAPTNLTLTPNTVLDGPIGDRLQAVIVSTGTYGGNTLVSVRGIAR